MHAERDEGKGNEHERVETPEVLISLGAGCIATNVLLVALWLRSMVLLARRDGRRGLTIEFPVPPEDADGAAALHMVVATRAE